MLKVKLSRASTEECWDQSSPGGNCAVHGRVGQALLRQLPQMGRRHRHGAAGSLSGIIIGSLFTVTSFHFHSLCISFGTGAVSESPGPPYKVQLPQRERAQPPPLPAALCAEVTVTQQSKKHLKSRLKRLSKRWQLLTPRVKRPFEKENKDANDWDTLLGFRKATADFDDASRIDCILAKRELVLAMSATNDHRLQLMCVCLCTIAILGEHKRFSVSHCATFMFVSGCLRR